MDTHFSKQTLSCIFFLLSAAKKPHTASLVVSPGDTAEFDVFFHSQKAGRMTGIIHLSVINNQYEETLIHMVGEGYEDDITLDNIHGLVPSADHGASTIPEVLEIAENNAIEDLVAGGSRNREVLRIVDSVIFKQEWRLNNRMRIQEWISSSLPCVLSCLSQSLPLAFPVSMFDQWTFTKHPCAHARHHAEPWCCKD